MFLVQANEIEFELTLKAVSPLLIRDGRLNKESREQWLKPVLAKIQSEDGLKKRQSDTPSAVPVCRNSLDELREAVTTGDPVVNVNGLKFYLPGSSLRGVWRSYLESLLRGLTPVDAPKVCDPLNKKAEALQSCSTVLTDLVNAEDSEDEDDGEERAEPRPTLIPYHASCPSAGYSATRTRAEGFRSATASGSARAARSCPGNTSASTEKPGRYRGAGCTSSSA